MKPRTLSFIIFISGLITLAFGLGVLSEGMMKMTFDYILILLVVSAYTVGGYGIVNGIKGLKELVERGE